MRMPAVVAVLSVVVLGDLLLGRVIDSDPLQTVATPWASPCAGLPLGADGLGRDVLARVVTGGRQLTLVALASAVAASAVGLGAGLWIGWSTGRVARVTRSIADVLLALPLLLIALVAAVQLPGSGALLVATVIGGAPLTLRVMADATRNARHAGYVEVALSRGEHPLGVALREVLPAHAGLVGADLAQRTVLAIGLASALAALGFGAAPPAPDWAVMLRENVTGIDLNPAATLAPALALAVVTGAIAVLARTPR